MLERLEDRCCPSDLVVDGTSVTLSGEHTYDNVQIVHGGTLYTDFEAMLKITAKNIFVDAYSAINAKGRGFRGEPNSIGSGPGGGQGGASIPDGGGGGGYGGKGGRGHYDGIGYDAAGGAAYGIKDAMAIDMGSAGGLREAAMETMVALGAMAGGLFGSTLTKRSTSQAASRQTETMAWNIISMRVEGGQGAASYSLHKI
jgi:hypothetical protein